ncbi:MAG: S-ribosylhomocysteine lyase [Firmicutes bacterium]|nr:S-ribosylhomocysteine lyase [Bacillota bacterium]MCM1401228.1 S-ribosylhomocysteine lyase [Bacteroides sp.]MCM1477223.1 S-ribosylhomocysteine lyase [Bacteroides sp.]
MEKIPSFTIDHLRLKRGVYVSRRDVTPSGDVLTTFDVRLTEPNRQQPLDGASLHAMEHLAATFLRNHAEWAPKVVYWGPMGCLTGNYLILQGELTSTQILPLLREMFSYVATFTGDIPGATPRDCGNYSYMDLDGARKAAATFLEEVLQHPDAENLNYPK